MDANHLFGYVRIMREQATQLRSLHEWRDRGEDDAEPWESFGGPEETAQRLDYLDEAIEGLQRGLNNVAGRA